MKSHVRKNVIDWQRDQIERLARGPKGETEPQMMERHRRIARLQANLKEFTK